MHGSDYDDIDLEDSDDESDVLLQKDSLNKYYHSVSGYESPPSDWAFLPNFQCVKNYFLSWLPSWDNLYARLPSKYNLLNAFLATATAIPFIPYTMQLFTATHPKDFSFAWWGDLSMPQQGLTAFMSVLTFIIAAVVHYHYFPSTAKKLLEILSDWSGKIGVNTLNIVLSAATMISAYGLGYDAMIPAGVLWAMISGMINSGLFGAFRLVFIPAFINRVKNIFDEDEACKQKCIQYLAQLTNKEEFNEFLEGKSLCKRTVKAVLVKLDERLDEQGASPLLKPYSLTQRIKHTSNYLLSLTLGAALFTAYALFNTQTGYRGMEVISELINDQYSIKSLPNVAKFTIGLPSGVSAGMLGFVLGYDAPKTFSVTKEYIKQHPHRSINIAILVGIITAALLDVGGIASPAYNVAADENNFVFVSMNNISGSVFVGLCAFVSFLIDYSGMQGIAFKNKSIDNSPPKLEVNDIINWLENEKEANKTVGKLTKMGLFASKESKEKSEVYIRKQYLA